MLICYQKQFNNFLVIIFQDRYISICEKKGIDPKTTQIHSWIEAVGGVRKNMILGHPQLRPSDVYGIFLLYLKCFTVTNCPI